MAGRWKTMQKAQRTPWGAFPQFLFGSLFLFGVVTLTACGAQPLPHTTVYVVSQYGTVYALKSQDGSIRWRSDMSRDQRSVWSASAGLTLVNGVIYTSSSDAGGYLYAIQPQDGNVRWRVRVHPEGMPSQPGLITRSILGHPVTLQRRVPVWGMSTRWTPAMGRYAGMLN